MDCSTPGKRSGQVPPRRSRAARISISLAVKDLEASKSFYEKLGFAVIGGEAEQNWLILRNGDHVIGLFQGMFEQNILTFNPGWSQRQETLGDFRDVRADEIPDLRVDAALYVRVLYLARSCIEVVSLEEALDPFLPFPELSRGYIHRQ